MRMRVAKTRDKNKTAHLRTETIVNLKAKVNLPRRLRMRAVTHLATMRVARSVQTERAVTTATETTADLIVRDRTMANRVAKLTPPHL